MGESEIRKEINGFEGYYISDIGKVYNKENKELCQWIDNVGYKQVNVRKDKKKYYKRVHRLVAEAFIPNPDNLPQVNHKDGDKTNNKVSNLEWISNKDNTQHGYDNGLYTTKHRCIGVIAISKEDGTKKEFSSIRSMCEELNLNRKTVSNILNGSKKTNNYPYIFKYNI